MKYREKANWIIGGYEKMTPDDTGYWYNRKLQKWLYDNSSNKSDLDEGELLIYDRKGNIVNADFNQKTLYGDYITEEKFIEIELQRADDFTWSNLSLEKRIVMERYRDFLKKRRDELSKGKGKGSAVIGAKFYALLHHILVDIEREKEFKLNENDQFSKKEIKKFAETKYPGISTQGFYDNYRKFRRFDRRDIAETLGRGYKKKIAIISGNDPKVIARLDFFPPE